MSANLRIVNTAVLLSATVLIVCSIATLYLTAHASTIIATYFPAGDYVWFGPRAPDFSSDYYAVRLAYDWTNETFGFAGAGVSIFTGLLGLVAYYTTRQAPSKFWTASTMVFSFLAFAASLLAFLRTTLGNATFVTLKTCDPTIHRGPNDLYTCTRELATCNLLETLIEHDFDERKTACQQIKAGRWALVPLAGAGILLFASMAIKICVHRRVIHNNRKSANLRVKELQNMAQI